VLAPRAAWRAALVAGTSQGVNPLHVESSVKGDEDTNRTGPSRPGAYQWTELMRRTFGLAVLACPRCDGRLRLEALIEQAAIVQRILRHLGLPREVPEPRQPRDDLALALCLSARLRRPHGLDDQAVRGGESSADPKLGHAAELSAKPGERVNLSAAGSSDPDGDALSYEWFYYGELAR
jgi:hypothetical protein